MEARINKQPNLTRNGQHPSWNRMGVTENDVMKLEMRFLFIFIFRKQ